MEITTMRRQNFDENQTKNNGFFEWIYRLVKKDHVGDVNLNEKTKEDLLTLHSKLTDQQKQKVEEIWNLKNLCNSYEGLKRNSVFYSGLHSSYEKKCSDLQQNINGKFSQYFFQVESILNKKEAEDELVITSPPTI